MPPEYCIYGPDFESHCAPWLLENHPAMYARLHPKKCSASPNGDDAAAGNDKPIQPWTMEERLTAFYEQYMPEKLENVPALLDKYAGKEEKLFTALVKKYGAEPEDPYDALSDEEEKEDVNAKMADVQISDGTRKKRRGVGAKQVNKVDTRVIIQTIKRNKKKAVTIVVGMDTVPGLKLKDVSKSFSKRFAGSSSVKDTAGGSKEIIIQGDHSAEVADMIVDKFKVDKDCVFFDRDGDFVPYSE